MSDALRDTNTPDKGHIASEPSAPKSSVARYWAQGFAILVVLAAGGVAAKYIAAVERQKPATAHGHGAGEKEKGHGSVEWAVAWIAETAQLDLAGEIALGAAWWFLLNDARSGRDLMTRLMVQAGWAARAA